MQYLSENKIEDKRVLLRCDYNVSVVDNSIVDTSKIDKSFKTINYLLENNNIVIIFSHFGRVKQVEDKKNNSLKIVYDYLKNYYDIEFIVDPLNLDVINNSDKKIYLVENTRFTDIPEKRESANDLELSKYWAAFGDVFVLDAFASSHRVHSSTAGLSNYLPTYGGFLLEDEINHLNTLVNNDIHPFVVIMGGAKVDDKILLIESILKKCDKLILTGGILNTFLKVSGKNVGSSLVSEDSEVLENVKRVLNNYKNKLYFTNLFVVKREEIITRVTIDEVLDNDIIFDNIPNVLDILNESKIIFFNGTCGKYEDDDFEYGTFKLLKDLDDSSASVYVGGGDTLSSLHKFGFENSFKFLSSGGGATLEYVAYGNIKALEYIEINGLK